MERNTLAAALCILAGVVLNGIFIGRMASHSELDTAKIFRDENGRQIIRTYEKGKWDQIRVQKTKDDSVYVSLGAYLKGEKLTEYDRKIEEAKIKKLVGW